MPASFDAIAPWYGLLETLAFGGALQRCRVTLLDQVEVACRVLIVGEGNGRFLEALLRRNRPAEVFVVDASQRMLSLARSRAGDLARVQFIHGDVRDEALALPEVDLVVTCFFLDCFESADQARVIQRLRRCLGPGGHWLWADFAVPESQPMNLVSRGIIALLYRFFGVTTGLPVRRLSSPDTDFRKSDLQPVSASSFRAGLLKTVLYRIAR